MSVRKIKIVVKDDIRIAKIDKSLNYDEQLKSIVNFVETKFNLSSDSYSLRYKDDEGDLITLADSGDLEEAYDTSGLPKIFIELKKKSKEGQTQVNNDNTNNTNEKEEKTSEEVKPCICGEKLSKMQARSAYCGRCVECDGCGVSLFGNMDVYHCNKNRSIVHPGGYDLCSNCYKGIKKVTFDQFVRDMKRNNRLKQEFEKFLVEFLSLVKKSNKNIKESLEQIINKYKELRNNDYVKKVMKEQLDFLISKYEDLVKFIAKNINPKDALIYFDMALTRCNNIKTFVLGIPPFKFLFDGLDNKDGNFNFNWGQTDDGNNNNNNNNNTNKKQESKEEKQQRKINDKKQKLEKKKQKLLEKLKALEAQENELSQSQQKLKVENDNNNNNNNNKEPEEEEMSEEFQILEKNIEQNEIEIINEEAPESKPKEEEEQQEDPDVIEEFAYQDKLITIQNMGFSNVELIKALLMKYNGNTAQTVNDLLQ